MLQIKFFWTLFWKNKLILNVRYFFFNETILKELDDIIYNCSYLMTLIIIFITPKKQLWQAAVAIEIAWKILLLLWHTHKALSLIGIFNLKIKKKQALNNNSLHVKVHEPWYEINMQTTTVISPTQIFWYVLNSYYLRLLHGLLMPAEWITFKWIILLGGRVRRRINKFLLWTEQTNKWVHQLLAIKLQQ